MFAATLQTLFKGLRHNRLQLTTAWAGLHNDNDHIHDDFNALNNHNDHHHLQLQGYITVSFFEYKPQALLVLRRHNVYKVTFQYQYSGFAHKYDTSWATSAIQLVFVIIFSAILTLISRSRHCLHGHDNWKDFGLRLQHAASCWPRPFHGPSPVWGPLHGQYVSEYRVSLSHFSACACVCAPPLLPVSSLPPPPPLCARARSSSSPPLRFVCFFNCRAYRTFALTFRAKQITIAAATTMCITSGTTTTSYYC